jgi:formylglycine-generating enzyme required for sulfatase activity
MTKTFYPIVTNAEWKAVFPSHPHDDDRPVVNISAEEVDEFCKRTGRYLPNETELNQFLVDEMISSYLYYWSSSLEKECRVSRGGCWGIDDPQDLRFSGRYDDLPSKRFVFIGFRCTPPTSIKTHELFTRHHQ